MAQLQPSLQKSILKESNNIADYMQTAYSPFYLIFKINGNYTSEIDSLYTFIKSEINRLNVKDELY